MATTMIPILCIDSRWTARYKWLRDTIPEDYSNYLDIWDSVPWQTVMHEDMIERDYNQAAPAQYLPKYADESVGDVADLLALLAADDIAEAEVFAQYLDGAPVKRVKLTDLLYRDFDRASAGCPIVFARPMSYALGGPGHLGDNSSTVFFIHAEDSCDGTTGLQPPEGGWHFAPEFRADAIHFSRVVPSEELAELIGEADITEAKLCAYIIAATAVPRIMINGSWHDTGTIPPDPPYQHALRGIKCVLGTAAELLNLSPGATNEITIEALSTYTESIGAQAIIAIEINEETEPEPDIRRRKMPSKGYAFGDIIDRWNIMITNLTPEIGGFVDAQPFYNELQQIIDEAQAINAQQEELKGLLKAKTEELYDKLKEGETKYSALVRYLKMKFGPKAGILTKYIPASEGKVDKTKEGYGDPEKP